MGHWQDKLVYIRDFAYPPRLLRLRMDNGNIGDVSAQSFAEYVLDPSQALDIDNAFSSSESNALDVECDNSGEHSEMRDPRPPLTARLHSHSLRVRANAKSQQTRLLSGPLVDIYVGEDKRHWSLHRNLLCHHSEYLASELLPNSAKISENALNLPDDDPSGFELLVKWLYQGKIEDVSEMQDPQRKYDYAAACHKLYLICDRFDIPQLKNMAIDQYRKGLQEAQLVPDAEEINEIYRMTPEGSPFRHLMTQIAARQIMDPESDRSAESYRQCFENNPEFAVQLVDAIKTGTGGVLFDDPTDGDRCVYHDHDNGSNCYAKRRSKLGPIQSTFRLAQPPLSARVPRTPQRKTSSPRLDGADGLVNGVDLNGDGPKLSRDGEKQPGERERQRSPVSNGTDGRTGSESITRGSEREGEGGDGVESERNSPRRHPPKLRRRTPPPSQISE